MNQRNFTSSNIEDIIVSQNFEIIWVKVIPKHKSDIKMFIFWAFSANPTRRQKQLSAIFHLLKMRYEGARFFFLGDFNDFKPDMILHLLPQILQTVNYPTYGHLLYVLLMLTCFTGLLFQNLNSFQMILPLPLQVTTLETFFCQGESKESQTTDSTKMLLSVQSQTPSLLLLASGFPMKSGILLYLKMLQI